MNEADAMTSQVPFLQGKTFKALANSANGEVGAETLFHYHEDSLSVDAGGRMMIQEKWQWTCDDHSEGESTLIEA